MLTANTIANRLTLESKAGETLLEELDADAETVAPAPAAPCAICFGLGAIFPCDVGVLRCDAVPVSVCDGLAPFICARERARRRGARELRG